MLINAFQTWIKLNNKTLRISESLKLKWSIIYQKNVSLYKIPAKSKAVQHHFEFQSTCNVRFVTFVNRLTEVQYLWTLGAIKWADCSPFLEHCNFQSLRIE